MMSDADRAQVVDVVAARPDSGVILGGSRGLRKLRIALAGRGKSGGGRIIYWYHSTRFPAVLLWVFAKNEADDLTSVQRRVLADATRDLLNDFRRPR